MAELTEAMAVRYRAARKTGRRRDAPRPTKHSWNTILPALHERIRVSARPRCRDTTTALCAIPEN